MSGCTVSAARNRASRRSKRWLQDLAFAQIPIFLLRRLFRQHDAWNERRLLAR
jgi:hypothetical protein